MCLTKPAEFECPDKGFGYKIFDRLDENKFGPIYFDTGKGFDKKYDLNCWYTREFGPFKQYLFFDHSYHSSNTYEIGFHVFLNPQSALIYGVGRNESICKVEYENVLQKGIQDESYCIVVEKMKIIKEIMKGSDLHDD